MTSKERGGATNSRIRAVARSESDKPTTRSDRARPTAARRATKSPRRSTPYLQRCHGDRVRWCRQAGRRNGYGRVQASTTRWAVERYQRGGSRSKLEKPQGCGSDSARDEQEDLGQSLPLKASTSAAEKLESKPRDYRYISPAPRARSHHRTTRARQPASAAHIKAARHNNHLQESRPRRRGPNAATTSSESRLAGRERAIPRGIRPHGIQSRRQQEPLPQQVLLHLIQIARRKQTHG